MVIIIVASLATLPVFVMVSQTSQSVDQNEGIKSDLDAIHRPEEKEKLASPLPILSEQSQKEISKNPIQNAPISQPYQISSQSNWISGGVSVQRESSPQEKVNMIINGSFLERVPRLARAIQAYEKGYAAKEEIIKNPRICGQGPECNLPTPATVGINETDFRIINATLEPRLVRETVSPAGAFEIRKVTEGVAGNPEKRIIEEKVFVPRPPRLGEEAVPAMSQKTYVIRVLYNDIIYQIVLLSTWKLP